MLTSWLILIDPNHEKLILDFEYVIKMEWFDLWDLSKIIWMWGHLLAYQTIPHDFQEELFLPPFSNHILSCLFLGLLILEWHLLIEIVFRDKTFRVIGFWFSEKRKDKNEFTHRKCFLVWMNSLTKNRLVLIHISPSSPLFNPLLLNTIPSYHMFLHILLNELQISLFFLVFHCQWYVGMF